jgi:hypothetical protein
MLTVANDANNLRGVMSTDHRSNAQAKVESFLGVLRADAHQKQLQPVIEECESLARAIAAFHLEGIRFRMFNVDRLLSRGELPVPANAAGIFSEVRRELEAAGFHTRSHQAPPTTA